MPFLKIPMTLVAVAQIILVPIYMKTTWPDKNRKSLIIKMICATLFVVTGVMAMFYAKNHTTYAYLAITALALGWIGDFFLHVSDSQRSFLTGLISFLMCHVFFIIAFMYTLKTKYGKAAVAVWEIFLLAVGLLIGYLIGRTGKVKAGAMFIPISFYMVTIIWMIIKAFHLAVTVVHAGEPNGVLTAVLLIGGAILFMISDSVLTFMMFAGRKGFGARVVNSGTYFTAQMFLAYTILFIGK